MSGPLAITFEELGEVQPEIKLHKFPGKGICLTFSTHDVPSDVARRGRWDDMVDDLLIQVKDYLVRHFHWANSALHSDMKESHLFIQGEGKGWLMIEFWCDDHAKIRNVVTLLRGRFVFKVEDELQ